MRFLLGLSWPSAIAPVVVLVRGLTLSPLVFLRTLAVLLTLLPLRTLGKSLAPSHSPTVGVLDRELCRECEAESLRSDRRRDCFSASFSDRPVRELPRWWL